MTARRILFTVAIVAHAGMLPAQSKAPVPSAQAQQEALAVVKEIYKSDYEEAKQPSQKETLANEMLRTAGSTKDPASRYALLRVARDLSLEAGGPTCLKAVDEMARAFQMDALDMKAKVLTKCSSTARTSAQSKIIAETGIALINKAVMEDRFTLAQQLGSPTLAAARKAKDSSLLKRITAVNTKVAEIAKAAAAVKPSLDLLQTDPTDPTANLAAGKYYCLMRDDWAKGVPMLALGSDPVIKALAVKELRGVSTPKEKVTLADGWWDLAEEEKGTAKEQLQSHAAGWYKQAAPQLTGLTKLKAEKRLQQLTKPAETSKPVPKKQWIDLLQLVEIDRDRESGSWQKRGRALASAASGTSCMRFPVRLDGSYDFHIEYTLTKGTGSVKVTLPKGWQAHYVNINTKGPVRTPTKHSLLCKMRVENRKVGLEVHQNGKQVYDWHGTLSDTPNRVPPKITSTSTPIVVSVVKVRLIAGPASFLPATGRENSAPE